MPTPEQLIKAGAHIGHKKSKWNPKMEPFVFGVRNNFLIIDVFKTIDKLKAAADFLKEVIRSGGKILFVGSKIQVRKPVKETAEELGMPYVSGRWLGGLFTNFKIIRERVKHFKELEEKKAAGELERYTKRERLNLDRELAKLQQELGGIKDLDKLPNAIFITDVEREKTALNEARKMKIPVVAIVDTDGDPTVVDWPIPANDSSPQSLELIYSTIRQELREVQPQISQETKESEATEEAAAGKDEGELPTPPSKAGRRIIAASQTLKDQTSEE